MKIKLYAWWTQFTEDTSPNLYITAHEPVARLGRTVQVIETDLDITPAPTWEEQQEAAKNAELGELIREINSLQAKLDQRRARRNELM